MSSPTISRAIVALGTAGILALSLSACIINGDSHANHAASNTPAEDVSTPTGKDLSKGGACEQGEDAFVNGSDLTVEITGACGSVRVEGANLKVELEKATSIAIRGENNKVSGDAWDAIVIQGVSLEATVGTAGSVDINGKDITFKSDVSNSILVTGDSVAVTTGDTRSIDLTGVNHTVNAQEVIDFIVVEGSDNTVNWAGGIEKENASNGEGNQFNRK